MIEYEPHTHRYPSVNAVAIGSIARCSCGNGPWVQLHWHPMRFTGRHAIPSRRWWGRVEDNIYTRQYLGTA